VAEVEYSSDPETEQAIISAIGQIMAQRRNEVTTRVIAIVEVMDDEGNRGLWICESPGMVTWDERGLLGYALDKVRDVDMIRRQRNMPLEDD
jgi:2-phospho-L-lactate transferase/gluconeogenesis factor (CofD/UPF0052 family)